MPLFEYACKKCGHQFETLVMGSTKPTCPVCNSAKLDKMLSTFAVSSNSGADSQPTMGACGSRSEERRVGKECRL